MNLHIDFLYEYEQRSASVINPVFVVRVILVIIPLVGLFFASLAWMQSRNLSNKLAGDEAEWSALEPRYKAAKTLQADLAKIRDVGKEIDAWRKARFTWPETLDAVRAVVPETIQLTQLQSEENLQVVGAVPVRLFRLRLRGRARGETPDETAAVVQSLRDRLVEHPYLVNVVSNAVIPRGDFKVDPTPGVDRGQFIFQVNAQLNPRRFE